MKFPYLVCKLTDEEQSSFRKQFYKGNVYNFEGVWYRNQSEVNKASSGWTDSNDNRQRVIHFFDDYKAINNELLITQSYIYVSTRLPIDEYEEYKSKVINTIHQSGYQKINNVYTKDDVNISIVEYDIHPSQKEAINNYKTIDVTFSTNDSINDIFFKKTWGLHVKGIREKEKRGNPTYFYSIEDIKKYLPAQVEMGCGPSIEAGIPPLYYLHEVYKVQRHSDGTFYFGKHDNFLVDLISDPMKKYAESSFMIESCARAKKTVFYDFLQEMYEKGYFIGELLNNNFDHIPTRYGIKEQQLRVYEYATYLPKINFDSKAKSLFCIGTHADRRRIQKQARENNLQIIYIDLEGFESENGFEPYPLEGAREGDIVFKMSASEFALLMKEEFLNNDEKLVKQNN